jgi:hypothetical protein
MPEAMVSEALKELFTLINVCAGALLLLALAAYLVLAQERRRVVTLLLLAVTFICLINAVSLYRFL